jgi:hypothetical protein
MHYFLEKIGFNLQSNSSRRLETKKLVREWLAMEIKELLGSTKH